MNQIALISQREISWHGAFVKTCVKCLHFFNVVSSKLPWYFEDMIGTGDLGWNFQNRFKCSHLFGVFC